MKKPASASSQPLEVCEQRDNRQRFGRILVIDDDVHVGPLIARIIRRIGHAADITTDGPSGIELARRGDHDVILLDQRMPGVSGLEVLALLHSAKITTPVIIVSGGSDPSVARKAIDAGAIAYLEKPIRSCELVSLVARVLRVATPRRQSIHHLHIRITESEYLHLVRRSEVMAEPIALVVRRLIHGSMARD